MDAVSDRAQYTLVIECPGIPDMAPRGRGIPLVEPAVKLSRTLLFTIPIVMIHTNMNHKLFLVKIHYEDFPSS